VIDKIVGNLSQAVGSVADGSTVLVGGFGDAGAPNELVEALLATEARDLTLVSNNAGVGEHGIAALLREHRVRRMVCSFPRSTGSVWFERRYAEGEVELEVVPQGTLAERIRAAGAGIGAFYTPTAAGTQLSISKEERVLEGRVHVLEHALTADLALIKADRADRWGNLVYRATARNFGPIMATAAITTVAQVNQIVPIGELSSEAIVTPGIYVDRVVLTHGA
jgi:3-oxoadipate CoA-transferase alpha subunit